MYFTDAQSSSFLRTELHPAAGLLHLSQVLLGSGRKPHGAAGSGEKMPHHWEQGKGWRAILTIAPAARSAV